jgi:hypothetical protein
MPPDCRTSNLITQSWMRSVKIQTFVAKNNRIMEA